MQHMTVLKRTSAIGAVLACALAVAGVATAAKISVAASFTYPQANSGTAWVCVKVSGPARSAIKVTVKGGQIIGARTKTAKIGAKGTVIVKFKTNYPSGYDFYVKSGSATRHAVTNLPQPGETEAKVGTFSCI
jgi:hypothetical protein